MARLAPSSGRAFGLGWLGRFIRRRRPPSRFHRGRLGTRWLRRQQSWLGPVLAGLLGSLLFVSLFSPFPYTVDAFGVTVGAGLARRGVTQLEVPPLGQIKAVTHRGPVVLTLTLNSIDIDQLGRLAAETSPGSRRLADILAALRRTVQHFLIRSVVLAALGGGLAASLLGWRRWRPLLLATLAALLLWGSLAGLLVATYDLKGFQQPQYSGVLRAAPWMVGLVEESILKVEELGAGLAALAGNLATLYQRVEALQPLARPPADLLVLIVSDIHNNPAAIDFIAQIVRSFHPDLLLDAGDLTDFGTVFEAPLIEGIAALGIPYVLAPGNHDAPEILAQLAPLENVHLLQGGVVQVAGLNIMGAADPSSFSSSPRIPEPRELQATTRLLEQLWREQAEPVDVLLVHNPIPAQAFVGRVPTIVSGHTHTLWQREQGGTLWLNPGSTGAAGIRGLQARQEIPYSLILAYWQHYPEENLWRVTATDTLRVYNFEAGFQLERRLFHQTDAPPEQERDQPEPKVQRQ